MGDNRSNSTDSRSFGPIPEGDIVGRAFVIIWPVSEAHGHLNVPFCRIAALAASLAPHR
jgi:hypothetical protein